MQWLGHNGTNELRCFIEGSKARNFEEFRAAFKGYAVSGQNLVYADNQGNIGLIAAYTKPLLKDPDKTLDLIKSPDNAIIGGVDSYDLPYSFNPETGFIASANNQPYPAEVPFSFEYSGYNRMQRMNYLCNSTDSITIDMLVDLQTDVMSYQGLELKELILEKVAGKTGPMEELNPIYWETFVNWDGNYHVDSKNPVAFETLMYFFSAAIIEKHYPEEYMKSFLMNDDRWLVLVPKLVKSENASNITELLMQAMKEGQKYFKKYDTWGDMHRLVFGSTLASIPLIGKKYKLADIGLGGSTNTLMKTAHPFTPEKHSITYGSNSRHISNMEDIDENYFVLLGGQDGWIKSPHNDDQLDLWLKEEYIRMPLRLETVQKEFNYHISNIN
jgi:penicillin amidase